MQAYPASDAAASASGPTQAVVDTTSAPFSAATVRHIQERVGLAIRRRRRMMDLTLQNLAVSCGVTFQQIQKYECGACSISAAQLWSVAVALDVPVAYFYEAVRSDGRPRTFTGSE
ncbi:helix-turn-helix transcriptional regulator [Phenylobacterium sp.]|uniref:helix-turn-helix domain-containing protein n=1 Tax=Phenylobacterium sp. TaxID=1871053 RepID=UPI00286B77AA|nr:helix-turn-helix transcriptional regulator [Phenylobacterium sp.]